MYNMLQNEVEMVTEDVQSQKRFKIKKKVFKIPVPLFGGAEQKKTKRGNLPEVYSCEYL